MTQEQGLQITDEDLQQLLRENPLASEQLRRIMAERRLREIEQPLQNGTGSVAELVTDDANT